MFRKREKKKRNPTLQADQQIRFISTKNSTLLNKQPESAIERIETLGNLDKKAGRMIEELPPDHLLRMEYASLNRKGCSKNVKKFEKLEKELLKLITELESELLIKETTLSMIK